MPGEEKLVPLRETPSNARQGVQRAGRVGQPDRVPLPDECTIRSSIAGVDVACAFLRAQRWSYLVAVVVVMAVVAVVVVVVLAAAAMVVLVVLVVVVVEIAPRGAVEVEDLGGDVVGRAARSGQELASLQDSRDPTVGHADPILLLADNCRATTSTAILLHVHYYYYYDYYYYTPPPAAAAATTTAAATTAPATTILLLHLHEDRESKVVVKS